MSGKPNTTLKGGDNAPQGSQGQSDEHLARLEAWIANGKRCATCGGHGTVVTHRPTTYCTDSPEEIADAVRMASRKCPDCPDFGWAVRTIREQANTIDSMLRCCGHNAAQIDDPVAVIKNVYRNLVTEREKAKEQAARIAELEASEEDRWDNHAVQCGNCSVEIMTRKGSVEKNNGLSRPEPVGSEDEALCGLCAGEEMYRLMGENEKLEQRVAELEAEVGRLRARWEWFFGATDKRHALDGYLTGVAKGWTVDQWSAWADSEIARRALDREVGK